MVTFLPPIVRATIHERRYWIAGSNAAQLRAAMGLLGPVRRGRRYGAYTDWEITWLLRYASGLASVDVALEASVVLPAWRPPRSASPALVTEWKRYLASMAAHERGHVHLAGEAARTLHGELTKLAASTTAPASLDTVCREAAQAILADYRERERRYDIATDHGASTGVVLSDGQGVEAATK